MERPDFIAWATSLPYEELIVYFVAGLCGMFAHWAKKAMQQEAVPNPITYFLCQHPWRTVSAVTAFAGTAVGFVLADLLPSMTWGQLIVQAFTAGAASNSLFNKGEPVQKGEPT